MIASRLLSILLLLQTRGRMSARALAEMFEVSVRTIHRDIDQLSAAGVPVYAERGRDGGFRLVGGYRTELTGLTQSEAETLFLAGLPGPAAQLGLSEQLSAARLKLMAALPRHVQPGAERIAARFHLDPATWFRATAPEPHLPCIAQAVFAGRMLKLGYRSAGEVRQRLLAPLGLVLKAGVWYFVAQTGKSIRSYRVSNVASAEVTDEIFARPKDFDLAAHWQKSSRDYETGLYREHADVRLSPRGMALLDLLGSYVVEAARLSAKPDRRGWMRCRLPIETAEQGVREFMRLGAEIEVVGPPALRAKLKATLAAMAAAHRD